MWYYIWPILMVIGANTCYNICAKSVPGEVNPFASLLVTYLAAAGATAVLFFATTGLQKNLFLEMGKTNWASLVLGAAVVALEYGYINVYRAGWKVSAASLTANIALACVLLVVGLLIFHESVSVRQIAGVVVCGVGLFLIAG